MANNPEISKIKLNNTVYYIKDEEARTALDGGGSLGEKFGGASYNKSGKKLEFYPNTNKVASEKLDEVSLSDISLALFSLTGVDGSNQPVEYLISLGVNSNNVPCLNISLVSETTLNTTSIPLEDDSVAMAGSVVGDIDYYSSGNTHLLRLFSPGSSTPFKTIDATDFIKDGMVDNVYIDDSLGGQDKLIVTFNTDAGKLDIEIPISRIFNAANYYSKTESDAKFVTAVGYDTTNGRATYTVNGNALVAFTPDSTPTNNSKKLVTSGGVYTALQDKASKSELTITPGTGNDADKTTILLKTGTSTTVLTQHQSISHLLPKYSSDATAWDTTPTNSSTKPITSGGVYTALNNLTTSINNALDDVLEDVTYTSSTRLLSKKKVGSSAVGVVILPTALYINTTANPETLEIILASTPS